MLQKVADFVQQHVVNTTGRSLDKMRVQQKNARRGTATPLFLHGLQAKGKDAVKPCNILLQCHKAFLKNAAACSLYQSRSKILTR